MLPLTPHRRRFLTQSKADIIQVDGEVEWLASCERNTNYIGGELEIGSAALILCRDEDERNKKIAIFDQKFSARKKAN